MFGRTSPPLRDARKNLLPCVIQLMELYSLQSLALGPFLLFKVSNVVSSNFSASFFTFGLTLITQSHPNYIYKVSFCPSQLLSAVVCFYSLSVPSPHFWKSLSFFSLTTLFLIIFTLFSILPIILVMIASIIPNRFLIWLLIPSPFGYGLSVFVMLILYFCSMRSNNSTSCHMYCSFIVFHP